jgi:hypothetical protein
MVAALYNTSASPWHQSMLCIDLAVAQPQHVFLRETTLWKEGT